MTTITLPRATVEQALEALEKTMNVWGGTCAWHSDVKHAITNLRGALAQQAEPVAPGATLTAQRDALLEALKYHQEQTRPIQRTLDVIKAVEEWK